MILSWWDPRLSMEGVATDYRALPYLSSQCLNFSPGQCQNLSLYMITCHSSLLHRHVAGCNKSPWAPTCFLVTLIPSQKIDPLSKWHLIINLWDKGPTKYVLSSKLACHARIVNITWNLCTEFKACGKCEHMLCLSFQSVSGIICLTLVYVFGLLILFNFLCLFFLLEELFYLSVVNFLKIYIYLSSLGAIFFFFFTTFTFCFIE
jgi:hypothetical protein